jgi:hypothetical protein
MAHQFAQHQQVDARGRQLGPIGVTQTVRTDPVRAGAGPVGAEDPSHPGFGQRLSSGRAAQHHEALRRDASCRPFGAQIVAALGEEGPIDRHGPFPVALADDTHPAHPAVDIGQPQGADLGSA